MKNFQFPVLLLSVALLLTACTEQKSPAEDNTEKSMNLTASDTTGQLMDEDEFWKIIEDSRAASLNHYDTQVVRLKTLLLKLNPGEIEKFDNTFTALLAASYDWKLWGAAYVINGGCSDDCFDYFREYLIGHGKEKFYQALKDPESCAPWIKSEDVENWEGLRYCAMDAYAQKTGRDLPMTYTANFVLKGKEFDEATVFKSYPVLAKKFAGGD
jgi:hypothetical protein